MSTTAHGYHCAPSPTPTTFKETARSETSLAEPPTSGGGVVGSVANPPLGGGGGGGGGGWVAPLRGSALINGARWRRTRCMILVAKSLATHASVSFIIAPTTPQPTHRGSWHWNHTLCKNLAVPPDTLSEHSSVAHLQPFSGITRIFYHLKPFY